MSTILMTSVLRNYPPLAYFPPPASCHSGKAKKMIFFGCTLVGQSIYCIGGENRNTSTWIPCTNTARRLDLADFNFELIFTLNWTVANSPVCTHNTVISTVQAPSNTPSVFVFGGDSTFNGTAIGYLLNPTDNSIIQTITDRTNSSLYAT
ncbi:hypothetical protein DM01DRAFT_314255 [Hesseltinella vesiculosa]|uniref:Uncharacterized protein n=1 Tax=Hesseltinella vesiculosa TaxID=101127 RepID=A0A1X2G930_9FUNG|nr:hypothetical protein DM01DRAFT_314255 [Hesseltinella vesiculosa]